MRGNATTERRPEESPRGDDCRQRDEERPGDEERDQRRRESAERGNQRQTEGRGQRLSPRELESRDEGDEASQRGAE
uniref:Uncharacterized protein n=1 Tax=Knipowitschia caucasica TaxID=637954 RepID=A0AAV2MKT2_KNICA